MINVSNIIKRNREINEQRSFINGMTNFEKEYLPEEPKRILEEAMTEIRNLTSLIGKETGWKHNGSGFVFNSNFIYNPNNEQIEFIENEIEFKDGVFVPKHNTKREIEFLSRNAEVLKKLEVATRKRDYYESMAYFNMIDAPDQEKTDKVEEVNRPSRFVLEEEQMLDAQFQANRFYNECGNDGLVLLVKWLNRMSNAEKPSDVFEEILGENVEDDKKGLILFWAGEYSLSGRYLEGEFLKRQQVKPKVEGYQKVHE